MNWAGIGCALLLVGYFLCLAGSVYCLIKGYLGLPYQFLASPGDLAEYVAQLRDHYSFFHAGSTLDSRVERDLRELLCHQHQTTADSNRKTNHLRMKWMLRSHRWIVGALVVLVLGFIPFLLAERETIQKVKVLEMPGGVLKK